jgi:peptidoglycan/LPS O-acetylase OafA/YrhL
MTDPTAGRRYVAALTGMRGVAAGLVFLYHYAALHPGIRLDQAVPFVGVALHFPFGFGFAGVDIFFVLSGFLLTLPFARSALGSGPSPDLPRYFRRRFLRVFPAYYAQLLILLLAGAWFVSWNPLNVSEFVAHLLMFFNIGWKPVQPMVGVWWTLPVEMGFYLLLPLLAPFLRPARWFLVLAGGIALSVAYRYWAAKYFGPLGSDRAFVAASQLPGNLAEFLLGATAALLVQYQALRGAQRPPAWLLDLVFVGGVLFPAIWLWQVVLAAGADYWQGHWSMLLAPIAIGLPLAMAIASLYWGCRVGTWLLANRVVYFLGLISYSLYLWHFVIMQQLQKLLGAGYAEWSHWVTFPIATGAVVGLASISYFLVERPFYRLEPWRKVRRKISELRE